MKGYQMKIEAKLTKQDVKTMYANGETPTDILRAATRSGIEFPDAAWLVNGTLHLDSEEYENMIDGYTNQI